jgi:hypothetical protein
MNDVVAELISKPNVFENDQFSSYQEVAITEAKD